MRKRWFFLSLCLLLWHVQAEVKNTVNQILYINSYDTSYQWSADILDGFRAYFNNGLNKPSVKLNVIELGILRNPGLKIRPSDEAFILELLQKKKYGLIVTEGKAATDLLLKHYAVLQEKTPVVFCAYTDFDREKRTQYPNLTGIECGHNFQPLISLILKIYPQTQKIAVITDGSPAGNALYQEYRQAAAEIKMPGFLFLHGAYLSTDEMLTQLSQLPQDSLVLLQNWRSTQPEPFIPYGILYPNIVRTAQHPVFTLQEAPRDTGVIGGILTNSREHGIETAKTAARILKGEKPADIPIQTTKQHPVFDWNSLAQWDIPAGQLPPDTVYLNKPSSFWENWKQESVITGAIALLLLIWYLVLGEQRRRNQKKLNGLFSALPIHVGVVDAKGKILFLQAGNQIFTGPRPEKLTDLPVELLREVEKPVRDTFRTGEGSRREYSVFGQHQQLEFLLLPEEIFGKQAVMWISADVTQLHDAFTAKAQLAQRFRLTLESIGDAVIVTDCDEKITLMNPMADKLTGYRQNEAVGRKLGEVFNFVSISGNEKVETPVTTVIRTEKEVILENHNDLISRDGKRYHIAASAAPIREEEDGISGAVLFFRDVTDDYEKRAILSRQNTILRNATEVANIVYFRSDRTGRLIPMGDFEKNWMYRDGQPVPAEEWLEPEDFPAYDRELRKLLSGETDSMHCFYRSNREAGRRDYEMRIIKSAAKAENDGEEYYGIIQDITETKENERRFQDNANLLKGIMDHLPCYMFVKNADDQFRYLMCNRGFAELTGLASEQLIGKRDEDIFRTQEEIERFRKDDQELLNSDKLLDLEEAVKDASGKTHLVRTMKTIVPQTDGKRLLLGMSIDVTRQKQLEQERLKMIEQLNNYIQCERTINQCLARISVENDFNKAIDEMLRVIGQNAGADRCYIFKYTDQEKVHSDNISEWIRDGVEPKLEKLRSIDLSPVPGWTRKLLRKQDLIIEDTDHPPQELAGEAEVLKEHKIQSVLASGIWLENNLWGYIGMEFIHSRRTFSDSDIHTVHSSTKLFLLARERYQQMNAIADSVSLQRQIVDNIAIPIAIFDKDSNIIAANPSLCKVCKIPLAEIVGKKCYDTICNHGNPPEWCPMQQTLSDKYPHSEEAEIHGRRFILTTQPIFDRRHELKYILKSAIDITELTQQKKQLQDAMEAAQAADRAKSYFIATMSHELKTPLNAVIGFSELLQMDNIPREEEKKDLQAINLAGHTLLNLINDVLDLSNMETDKLEINPEPMNLKELLSEMPTIFRQTSESKKAPMELLLPERLPRLVLDPKRLRQILINLVGITYKNIKTGKVILSTQFRIHPEKKDKGTLIIRISNSDAGLALEKAEHLFEPFSLHTVRGNRSYEETGLELTLAQRLCNCMDGRIEVNEKESTLVIIFENVSCIATELPPKKTLGRSPDYARINQVVLVDDVPMNLKVMSAMFKRLNIPHVCCKSAREAIQELEKAAPTAVFTDLWMPDMGGDELAQYMARTPSFAEIPVIVVTADTQIDKNARRWFKWTLFKPITIEALRECLQKTLPGLLERNGKEENPES